MTEKFRFKNITIEVPDIDEISDILLYDFKKLEIPINEETMSAWIAGFTYMKDKLYIAFATGEKK
jgi:hypothetical protein